IPRSEVVEEHPGAIGGLPGNEIRLRCWGNGVGAIGPVQQSEYTQAVDVGCGSAIASLVLAVDDPTATVTGIDWGPVVEAASRLAEALGVASRASFVAGDVTTLQRLDRPFDVAFFGWVLHYLDPIEIRSTLRQVHRLLAPSGRIVILEVLPTPGAFDDPYPYLAAVTLFNVARRGRVYTFEEYAAMLTEASFGPARRLEGTPWLQAERGE
ncbi:MAG: class I SAM-dependent methyltransferase, partial [Candidatus Limnocylindrales bacterium]